MEPLMVVANSGEPVKFTIVSAMTRSNSVPLSTGAIPVVVAADSAAKTDLTNDGKLNMTPPAARP